MHGYEFLQRYGPTALVVEVTDTLGEAFASELGKGGFDLHFADVARRAAGLHAIHVGPIDGAQYERPNRPRRANLTRGRGGNGKPAQRDALGV